MILRLHKVFVVLGMSCLLVFWSLSLWAEILGDPAIIKTVKMLIFFGMSILIPSMIGAGVTGFKMGGKSTKTLVKNKKLRMPIIAANGLFILFPLATWLYFQSLSPQQAPYYDLAQKAELAFGALNIALMILSVRDGMRLKQDRQNNRKKSAA